MGTNHRLRRFVDLSNRKGGDILSLPVFNVGEMMQPPIGQIPDRARIINITNSLPCFVQTDGPHFFPNKAFVRLTDLNGAMPVPRGEDELNNGKFRVIVTAEDTFYLQDPITFVPIDSTNFPPYVTGGSANLVQPNFVFYPSPEQAFPN